MSDIKKNLLYGLLVCFKLVSIVLYSVILFKYRYNVDHNLVLAVSRIWQKPLIGGVFFKDTLCENEKEEYNILEGNYWLGNVEGCFCEKTNTIQKGNCTSPSNNCSRVYNQSSIEFKKLKGSILCYSAYKPSNIKKAGPINLFDYKIISRQVNMRDDEFQAQCGSGFKICGYPIKNLAICVPLVDNCPISNLHFFPISSEVPDKFNNYTRISNDKVQIYYKESSLALATDTKLYTRLKITSKTGGIPCKDPRYMILPTSYVLKNNRIIESDSKCPKGNKEGIYEDVFYGNYSFGDLVEDNLDVKEAILKLPDFTTQGQITLFSLGYPEISIDGLNEIKKNFPNTSDFFTKIKSEKIADFESDLFPMTLVGLLLCFVSTTSYLISFTKSVKKYGSIVTNILVTIILAFNLSELYPLIYLYVNRISHPFIYIEESVSEDVRSLFGLSSIGTVNRLFLGNLILSVVSIIIFLCRYLYLIFIRKCVTSRVKKRPALMMEKDLVNL